MEAKTEDVDVAAMVRSVVEEMRDLAEQRRHALTLSLGDDLPRVKGIGLLLLCVYSMVLYFRPREAA